MDLLVVVALSKWHSNHFTRLNCHKIQQLNNDPTLENMWYWWITFLNGYMLTCMFIHPYPALRTRRYYDSYMRLVLSVISSRSMEFCYFDKDRQTWLLTWIDWMVGFNFWLLYIHLLNVNYFRNVLLVSSFWPKYQRIFLRISALVS